MKLRVLLKLIKGRKRLLDAQEEKMNEALKEVEVVGGGRNSLAPLSRGGCRRIVCPVFAQAQGGHLASYIRKGQSVKKERRKANLCLNNTSPINPAQCFASTSLSLINKPFSCVVVILLHGLTATMSDTFQELADIPKDFVKDGMLFVNRCTKRMSFIFFFSVQLNL